MRLGTDARFVHASSDSNAKRNFILQQGLREPVAGTCPLQYSALLFQPRLVGPGHTPASAAHVLRARRGALLADIYQQMGNEEGATHLRSKALEFQRSGIDPALANPKRPITRK